MLEAEVKALCTLGWSFNTELYSEPDQFLLMMIFMYNCMPTDKCSANL